MERTPIWNELHLRMKTFKTYIDFPFYRIRKGAASDRLARKASRERGLMRTPLCYSS